MHLDRCERYVYMNFVCANEIKRKIKVNIYPIFFNGHFVKTILISF